MNRDDRLFAIIGGAVVALAAAVFLLAAGGITGPSGGSPTIRVAPIETAGVQVARRTEPTPGPVSDVVRTAVELDSPVVAPAWEGLLGGLSSHPQWASWIVTDDLLARAVSAVEAVADGYSPSDELGFMTTGGPFLVREDGGRLVIAAGTYRRYRLAVEVLRSIDAEGVVAIYRRLEPEIEALRADAVWHRGDFEDRLRQAVDHLLAVDIPSTPIEVERRTVTFAFADDRFERLSGAQRQLLRMGRANAEAVQESLLEIRAAFGWPEPASTPLVDDTPVMIAERDPESGLDSTEISWSPMVEPMVSPWDPRLEPVVTGPFDEPTATTSPSFYSRP